MSDENNNEMTPNRAEELGMIFEKVSVLTTEKDLVEAHKEYRHCLDLLNKFREEGEIEDPEKEQQISEKLEAFRKNYDWAVWANYNIKKEICDELENVLESMEKQELLNKFDELKIKWKETGPIPKEKTKELVGRYRELCKKTHEKNLSFFNELEHKKEDNYKVKLALCEKIEALTQPENWNEAADFVRKAQKNWNALGPVPKEQSDEIWSRFQKSCNTFFNHLKEYYKDLKHNQKENLRKKRELCEKVEGLKESQNWKETSQEMAKLQKEWKKIGPASKKQEKKIWTRFKSACDAFYHHQKEYFEKLENSRPENLKKKEALCERLENMGDIPDDEKYRLIIKTQGEWKDIGAVPREKEQPLWERFRKPIDAYFDSRKERQEEEKKHYSQRQEQKLALCEKAEELMNSSSWRETKEEMKALQKEWNEIGRIPRDQEKELWKRFKGACDYFFNNMKQDRDKKNEVQEDNYTKKLDLCYQAEIISNIETAKELADQRAQWQLKKLTENFWFKVVDEDSWESKSRKLKELQREWKSIGPVPKARSQEIWERFQSACNYFFENKN